ncbi:MAG: hypothetical protein Q7S57_05060 [bacterium]|nr:hypothetical protein [bacterium]
MKKFFLPILLVVVSLVAYNLGRTLGVTKNNATADQQNIDETSQLDGHHTKDLVMHCMDFRFQGMEHRFTCDTCGRKADKLSWPGAVKILNSDNPALKEEALDAIKTAIEKHGIEIIHLINHLDCGGYGGSTKHADTGAEKQFHADELTRAGNTIHERFKTLVVRKYIASRQGIEELAP